MSITYHERPSKLLNVEREWGDYTAYCFDEACMFIMAKIKDREEPQYRKGYKSFSDFYRQFDEEDEA